MQRIPSFLRNWQTVITVLAVLIAIAVLFSRFAPVTASSMTEVAVIQPTLESEDLLESNEAALPEEHAQVSETPVPTTIVVYVSGAVRAPDVYTLPVEARVKDLVMAAGGLADDADSERINLADHLKDADHIHVPRQGEATNPAAPDAPRGTHVATEGDGLININTASVAELDTLPGIGPAFAQRIVDYRMANGPFASTSDLSNVKGIGPALLEKIAPKISAESP